MRVPYYANILADFEKGYQNGFHSSAATTMDPSEPSFRESTPSSTQNLQ
jgi:hypothetical protein